MIRVLNAYCHITKRTPAATIGGALSDGAQGSANSSKELVAGFCVRNSARRRGWEKSDWVVEILGASGELLHRVASSWLTHKAGIE
jgi:hypothetical protein